MSARPASGGAPVVVGQDFFINRAKGGRGASRGSFLRDVDESSLSSASEATPGPLLRSASSAVDDAAPYFGSGYGPDDAIGPEPSIGGGSSLSSLSAYDLAHVRSFEDRRRDYERTALPTIASPSRRSRGGGNGSDVRVSSPSSEKKGALPTPPFPDVEQWAPFPDGEVQWPDPPSQDGANCSAISGSAKEDETFGEYVATRIRSVVPAKRRLICLLAVLGVVLVGLVAVAAVAVASTTSSGKATRGGMGGNSPMQQAAMLQDRNSEGDGGSSVGEIQGSFDSDGEISATSGDGVPPPPSASLPAVEAVSALPSPVLQDDVDPARDEITLDQVNEISTGVPEMAPPDNLFVTQSLADEEVEMIPFDDGSNGPTVAPSAAVVDPQTAWPSSSPPTSSAPTAVATTGEPTRWPTDPPSRDTTTPGPTARPTESPTTLRPTRRPTPLPSPAPTKPTPRPTTRCEARCEEDAVLNYENRMGFPSVKDAIEHCSAKAAKEDTYGARNGICNTKCWRRCRDKVKGRDADVREALESERLVCLSDCGR